jgi:hypothetical protein
MPSEDEDPADALPAHVQVIQMATGFLRSRALYAAAELGLADHLADGPGRAEDVADATGAHAPSLRRLMRALAHWGILSTEEGGRFSLTPLGAALRSDAPGEARSTVRTVAGDGFWNAVAELPATLDDGEPGFEKAFGTSWFEHLADHPEEASHFNDTMIGFHGAEPPAVAEAYDFSDAETVVDVGGGTGHMLATICERHPGPEGVLFELPRVVREAPALLEERGVAERVTCEAGSFFEEVPEGGDVYILSHILHDWPRDRCLAILRNCRAAMGPDSRLLIVEMVLPEEPPHPGYELDMVMLALTGGRERTADEYGALLNEAGLSLERVLSTDSPVSVVEAARA